MTTYSFRKEEFPSLAFEEYLNTWSSLGIEELSPSEAELMTIFLSYAGDYDSLDLSNVLLVKAAEGGILKDVYGPSLFKKQDDQLVLKVGNNEFEVRQEKMSLFVGQLEGTLSFEDRPTKIKLKDANGEEYEVEIYNATCDLMPADGTELEFRVRCSWNSESNPQPGAIKAAMRRGESIARYFRAVPAKSEGGNTLKMQDLGEGEFKLAGTRKLAGGKYGDSYILELADGRSVWARGTVAEILKTGWEMPKDTPVSLSIANIRERSEGKFSLDCALRLREPRDPNQPRGAVRKPNVRPITPVPAQRQLVAAAIDAELVDDIPF